MIDHHYIQPPGGEMTRLCQFGELPRAYDWQGDEDADCNRCRKLRGQPLIRWWQRPSRLVRRWRERRQPSVF